MYEAWEMMQKEWRLKKIECEAKKLNMKDTNIHGYWAIAQIKDRVNEERRQESDMPKSNELNVVKIKQVKSEGDLHLWGFDNIVHYRDINASNGEEAIGLCHERSAQAKKWP